MDSILSFLGSNYPIIGMILLGAYIVYKLSMYHVSIQITKKKVDHLPCDTNSKKIDKLEMTLVSLPCEKHTQKIDEHNLNFENLRDILIEMQGIKKNKRVQTLLFNRFSPYTLSDTGQKYLEITGGKECIETNISLFIAELDKMQPQTAYDVEDYSERILIRYSGNTIFKKIKDYVYVTPLVDIDGENVEVSLPDVVSVMNLYLRDKYLELHPELIPNIEE